MLPQIATLLESQRNKHILGYTVAVITAVLISWYSCAAIKQSYWNKVAGAKAAQVQMLEQKLQAKDVELGVINTKLDQAGKETSDARQVAKVAQAKVDALIKGNHITIWETNYNATAEANKECEERVAALKVEAETKLTTLMDEITADRTLIVKLDTENALHLTKETALEDKVGILTNVSSEQKKIIVATEEQLSAEKTKTKIWRRVSYGAGLVALILLL